MTPAVALLVDGVGSLKASVARGVTVKHAPCEDFQVLVPIYGAIRYLENVEYLRQYGKRVVLCTTTHETPEFNRSLEAIAAEHGFTISRTPARKVRGGRRATGGTIRDRVVRDALPKISADYVVCIDADSTTPLPFQELVGEMQQRGLDLASVPLVPSNERVNGLTQLQSLEYRLSMKLRRVVPWLVSGACHAARTDAYRAVMARHSLFFQGNDVELGVLAHGLGYRVGHVLFDVATAVPQTLPSWWRQRVAWAGGEVRLFVVNPQLVFRHPFLWVYGGLVVILALPLRWWWLSAADGRQLISVSVTYLVLVFAVHRRQTNVWLLLLPVYAAFLSLVMVPLGLYSYCRMAIADRNAGLIRLGPPSSRPLPAVTLRDVELANR